MITPCDFGDYQDYDTKYELNDFLIKPRTPIVNFLLEVLMEEVKHTVIEEESD